MKKLIRNSFAKRFIRTALSVMVIAMLATMLVCAYSVTKPAAGDYFICASSNSGYCLDVTSGSTSPQALIQLWEKSSGNAAQIFSIQHYSGDWYRIVNKNTGHIINVPSANSANGQQLWMWTNDDYTDASLWRFLNAGNGNYIIQNKLGKVIDLDNNLVFSGSRVHLWSQHGGNSCRWKLVSASQSTAMYDFSSWPANISQGTYKIALYDNSNLCLNVLFKSTQTMSAAIGVDGFNSESNELFVIMSRGNGYYSIHPKHAGYLCLNAKYANKTPGDPLTLYTYENGDYASLWSFHKYQGGSYAIKNKATGLVIDITNGDYSTGNKAINWTPNNYKRAQAFWLTRVSSDTTLTQEAKIVSPMNNYKTTQSFGKSGHLGIDMSSGDTRVFSIADGVVCFAGSNGTTQDAYKLSESQRKGNGYCIVIRHNIDGKTVYSFYGHLKEGSFKVSNNQTVKAGQQIATMGNTGRSTAPHLHFAIANGYSAGKYYGYTSNCKTFYSNTKTRGVTFYNPAYVLQYKKLP